MADFGEAIALGVAKGLGEGYQTHLAEQRRERASDRRMAKTFDMFKKQSQYSYGLQQIGKQTEALGAWESAAKMSTNDIAYKAAVKMSEPYSKADKPKVIQNTLKNFQGVSKADLLARLGYSKPDYSQWIDNPDYQDAIPRARLAGMDEMPDMEQTFKYDPRNYADVQKEEAAKKDKYDKDKKDTLTGINNMAVIGFGAKPSEELAITLWKGRPKGIAVEMKGADAISYDNNLLTSWLNSGQAVKVGAVIKLRSELTMKDKALLGISEEPLVTSQGTQSAATLYTEPTTEAYIEEKKVKGEAKEMDKAIQKIAKSLGTGKGTPLTTHTELQESLALLDSMDEDALDYLFTAGYSTDTARDLAAKAGSGSAQKAKDLISKMSGTVNNIRHELFGSALTEGESAAFQKQFADVGTFNTKENLRNQLVNLINKAELGVAEKMAGFTPEQREEFKSRNKSYTDVMRQVDTGTEVPQGFLAAKRAELVASGKYTPEQIDSYIQYLSQQQ